MARVVASISSVSCRTVSQQRANDSTMWCEKYRRIVSAFASATIAGRAGPAGGRDENGTWPTVRFGHQWTQCRCPCGDCTGDSKEPSCLTKGRLPAVLQGEDAIPLRAGRRPQFPESGSIRTGCLRPREPELAAQMKCQPFVGRAPRSAAHRAETPSRSQGFQDSNILAIGRRCGSSTSHAADS